MKLGVDFGTTRIVAAAVDRGNYPVVPSKPRMARLANGFLRCWRCETVKDVMAGMPGPPRASQGGQSSGR